MSGMNLKNLYQNEYSFEETINENMLKIEQFSHLSVKGYLSSSTDESVVAGDKYIIANDENGENNDLLFSSKVNQIAYYNNNLGWLFYEPKDGDIAYNQTTGEFLTFNNSIWNTFTQGSGDSSSGQAVDTSIFLKKSESEELLSEYVKKDESNELLNDCLRKSKNLLDITDQDTACKNIGTLRDWQIRRLGDYKMSAQPKDHDNWLICDGREISRITYADLFALIGTTCGAGNGSTTFNIPNFINRTMWGATTVYNDDKETIKSTNLNSTISAGLPNIKGTAQFGDSNNGGSGTSTQGGSSLHKDSTAPFFRDTNWAKSKTIRIGNDSDDGAINYGIGFDASKANSIYGASNTVQPPAIAVNVFILAKV